MRHFRLPRPLLNCLDSFAIEMVSQGRAPHASLIQFEALFASPRAAGAIAAYLGHRIRTVSKGELDLKLAPPYLFRTYAGRMNHADHNLYLCVCVGGLGGRYIRQPSQVIRLYQLGPYDLGLLPAEAASAELVERRRGQLRRNARARRPLRQA